VTGKYLLLLVTENMAKFTFQNNESYLLLGTENKDSEFLLLLPTMYMAMIIITMIEFGNVKCLFFNVCQIRMASFYEHKHNLFLQCIAFLT